MPAAKLVFHTSTVRVLDVRCPAGPQAPGDVEIEPAFAAVLPRRGVFVYHAAGRRMVADPSVGFLLNQGDEHRTTHPSEGGDRNTVLALRTAAADQHLPPSGGFAYRCVPIPLAAHIRHHELLSAMWRGATTALEVDEWAVRAIGHLAGRRDGAAGAAHHQALVADAREYLAAHYADDADLRSVATAVGSSPHHLSRLFTALADRTMSAYRTELRLRHVVDHLADGHDDLARLAVEAGFFDHAHMTRTMTRHAGAAPSRLRELLAA